MSIRRIFQILNGIAIIMSVPLGIRLASSSGPGLEDISINPIAWIVVSIQMVMGILILVLDLIKAKVREHAAYRELGVVDVKGNGWLDQEGIWRDGYDKIMLPKVSGYYVHVRKEYGYIINSFWLQVSCVCIPFLLDITVADYADGGHMLGQWSNVVCASVIASIFWFYVLLRKVIIG